MGCGLFGGFDGFGLFGWFDGFGGFGVFVVCGGLCDVFGGFEIRRIRGMDGVAEFAELSVDFFDGTGEKFFL